MREAIERVIAELQQKLDEDSITSVEYLCGYMDGRQTISELLIYKLKAVIAEHETGDTRITSDNE